MARIISQQKFGYFEYNFLDANLPGLGNKIFLKNRKFSYNITNQCFFYFIDWESFIIQSIEKV